MGAKRAVAAFTAIAASNCLKLALHWFSVFFRTLQYFASSHPRLMAEKISRSDIEWLVQYPSKSTAPSYELPTVNSSKGHVEHVFTLQREIASVAVESAVDPVRALAMFPLPCGSLKADLPKMKPSDVSQPTSSVSHHFAIPDAHACCFLIMCLTFNADPVVLNSGRWPPCVRSFTRRLVDKYSYA